MVSEEMTVDGAIRVVDVFSGAGGLSLGWINAAAPGGVHLVAALDADSTLTPLYERNFPETRFIPLALASDSDPEQAKRAARAMGVSSGEVDVLLAGPPCQTLSQAGKREDHEANRLVICVCDLARFLRPKVV